MKIKVAKLKEQINSNYVSGVQWILLGIVLLFYMLTMYYADIKITYQFSFSFLDALFDGKVLDFYQYALDSGVAPEGAVYDIVIYIIFAIWGLPVWILHKIISFSYLSIGCMLWFKCLLVVFAAGTVVQVRKLARLLMYSDEILPLITFIYSSSLLLVMPLFCAVQYDIIPLFFLLCGMNCYFGKKKLNFILFFAFAISMKPFAVLLFIPLVVLKEKRVGYILVDIVEGLSIMLICKLLYITSEAYRLCSGKFLVGMSDKLFEVGIPSGAGTISLFCVGMIVICIVAYCVQTNEERINQIAIIIAFSVWAVFICFVDVYPYWIVYMAPFLTLIIFMNQKWLNLSLILELVFGISLIGASVMNYEWVYGGTATFSDLFLSAIYRKGVTDQLMSVGVLLERMKLLRLLPLFNAITFVSVTTLIIIYIKGMHNSNEVIEKIDKWHVPIRIVTLYGWALLCITLLYIGCA